MEGIGFDRIAKALAASSARRQALRASLASVLATGVAQITQETDVRGTRKKKCKALTERCSETSSCCCHKLGVLGCREHLAGAKATCASRFPGRRCCALEGVRCDLDHGHCDCCDDLVCDVATDGKPRCQPSEP